MRRLRDMKRVLTTVSLLGCVLFSSHASSVYINVGYGSSTIPSYTTPRPFPSCAPTVVYGYSNHPVVTSGRCISIVKPAAPCVVTPRPPVACAPTYIVPTSAVLDTTCLPSSSFNPSSTRNFEQLGGDWAHDLRQDIVTWDAFVDFLK